MKKKDLLNCPFCGDKPIRTGEYNYYSSAFEQSYDEVEIIECRSCEVRNDECFWNNRAAPEAVFLPVQRIDEIKLGK